MKNFRIWAVALLLTISVSAQGDAVVNTGSAKFTSFIVTELAFESNIYNHTYQATIPTQYITKANLDKIAVIVSFRPEAKYGWTALPYADGSNFFNVTYYIGQVIITCNAPSSKRDFKIVIVETK